MPKLDAFGKSLIADEMRTLAKGALSFTPDVKTHVSSREVDGIFRLKTKQGHAQLKALPYPWPLFEKEVALELKMKGDKLDKRAFKRAMLQRAALEVHRYDTSKFRGDLMQWILAPRLPGWLRSYTTVTNVAQGVYRVEAAFFPLYWIAANELPLHPALFPFLIARDGKPLEDFVAWAAFQKSPKWVTVFMEVLNMEDLFLHQILKKLPRDPGTKMRSATRIVIDDYLDKYPEVVQDLETKTLLKFLQKKLGQAPTKAQERAFKSKLAKEGRDAVEDKLLAASTADLEAWLAPKVAPTKAALKKPMPKKTTRTKK